MRTDVQPARTDTSGRLHTPGREGLIAAAPSESEREAEGRGTKGGKDRQVESKYAQDK